MSPVLAVLAKKGFFFFTILLQWAAWCGYWRPASVRRPLPDPKSRELNAPVPPLLFAKRHTMWCKDVYSYGYSGKEAGPLLVEYGWRARRRLTSLSHKISTWCGGTVVVYSEIGNKHPVVVAISITSTFWVITLNHNLLWRYLKISMSQWNIQTSWVYTGNKQAIY